MTKKYALHPGWITSKSDGDRHWISSGQLARLYKLRPDEYVVWSKADDGLGRNRNAYIHLYPKYDGDYGRPDE